MLESLLTTYGYPILVIGTFLEGETVLVLGGTLTATSIGITARVLNDLQQHRSREAHIVIGAAVMDDVLGLVMLAIVSGIVVTGSVALPDILRTIALASLFIVSDVRLEEGEGEADAEREALKRKLAMSVNEIELSVRAANCLNNANLTTVGELALKSEADMLKYRNFGKKSLNEIKDKLKELGVDENTIVMYSTDNGAEFFSWPDGGTTMFRNEKATQWEGGFRVPTVIRWPGVIKPGTIINDICAHEDMFATLVAAAGNPNIKDELLQDIGNTTNSN